jgi:hypothetical protein
MQKEKELDSKEKTVNNLVDRSKSRGRDQLASAGGAGTTTATNITNVKTAKK